MQSSQDYQSDIPEFPTTYNKKKSKWPNKAPLGFLMGIILPLTGILLLYFKWGNGNFVQYLKMFTAFQNPKAMNACSKIIVLAVILNLAIFHLFLYKKRYNTVRGIIIATMFWAVVMLIYKFVLQ